MSLAALWPAPVRLAPTDSRRPSHALLAYDGNMVALRLYNDLKGLWVQKWPP